MNLREFERHHSSSTDLQLVQDRIHDSLAPLESNPLSEGVEVSATIGTSATAVEHGLGRTPEGWTVLDRDADARIWRTAWDDNHLTLQASASVDVKLWVV